MTASSRSYALCHSGVSQKLSLRQGISIDWRREHKMHLRVFLSLGIVATTAFGCLAADASKLPGGTWASIQKLPELNGIWETTPLGDPRGLPIPGSSRLRPNMQPCGRNSSQTPIVIRRKRIVCHPVCRELWTSLILSKSCIRPAWSS